MGGASSRTNSFSSSSDTSSSKTATTAVTAVFEHPDAHMRQMAEDVLARIFTYGAKDVPTIIRFAHVKPKWQALIKKQIQHQGEVPTPGMKLVDQVWRNIVLRTRPAVERSICSATATHTANSQQRTYESTDPYQNVTSNAAAAGGGGRRKSRHNSFNAALTSNPSNNSNNNGNSPNSSGRLSFNDSGHFGAGALSRGTSQVIRPEEIEEQPDEKVKSGKQVGEDFVKLSKFPQALWIIEKLIYKGRIDVNYRSIATNNTALITAVEVGNVQVVPTLVTSGARIDKRGAHGKTALLVACQRGDVTLARFLIDHNADPSLHDALGTTCVSACLMSDGSAEILEMLIATKKIDWDAAPPPPPVPNNSSSSNNESEIPHPPVMAKSALGAALGAAVAQAAMNAKNHQNNNNNNNNDHQQQNTISTRTSSMRGPPLLEACRQGASVKTIKMILSAGADPNVAEKSNGVTALLAAVKTGRTDIAKVLVAAGADVNKSSANSVTPLMAASVTGDLESARFLISKGAHLNVRDHQGNSALQLAKNHNCPQVVALLKDHGAN